MVDGRVYTSGGGGGVSNLSVLRQNQRPISSSSSQPVDSFFLSGSSNSALGSSSMVNFEDVRRGKRSNTLFFCPVDQDDIGDDDYDDYLSQPGKKRRLTCDQVKFLEQSFEVENKLEPERKVQLAKDLNMQPKQVAIWFQNRRARWKSKQLEKDYDALQSQFDSLKANYDNLLKEKEKLKAEVDLLSDKLKLTEKEAGTPKSSDATEASQTPPKDPIVESTSEISQSKVSTVSFKQDNQNSGTADVFESDSTRYTDMAHSSTYIFEHEYHSDISQDDEDSMSRSLLVPLNIFPKLEDDDLSDLPANSCSLGGFPVEDQAIWSWCL